MADELAETITDAAKEKKELAITNANLILNRKRSQLGNLKANLKEKESFLENRVQLINTQSDIIEEKKNAFQKEVNEFKVAADMLVKKLEEVSELKKEQVEQDLKLSLNEELSHYQSTFLKKFENREIDVIDYKINEELEEITSKISVDYYVESTPNFIRFENKKEYEEFKNKIETVKDIFIKIIEVDDLLFEEEKFEIRVQVHDPIKREVSGRILKRFQSNKSLSLKTAEEILKIEKEKILQELLKAGEYVAKLCGFPELPKRIKLSLGKCKYRFSYGQNLLKHNIEMAELGEALATKLGADIRISKLACLLHDIGKVEEEEGEQHHHISAEIVKEFDDSEILYNAIIAHHYDIDAKYVEAEIVRIADSISGSRPGARRYSPEEYYEKIKALEEIASTKQGVKSSFALQAGREIRVIVDENKVTDKESSKMAKDIATEIEETLSYPGVISVNVIRETIVNKIAETESTNE